jgi:hypothetical protein
MNGDLDARIADALELRRDLFLQSAPHDSVVGARTRRLRVASAVVGAAAALVAVVAVVLVRGGDGGHPAARGAPTTQDLRQTQDAAPFVAALLRALPDGYKMEADPAPIEHCDWPTCIRVVEFSQPAKLPFIQLAVVKPAPGATSAMIQSGAPAKTKTRFNGIYSEPPSADSTHVQVHWRGEIIDLSSTNAAGNGSAVRPYSVDQLATFANDIRIAAASLP